ncbi:MAG TPA: DUF1445 domain-containing protein [Candidatus Methylomirabilis sp.]
MRYAACNELVHDRPFAEVCALIARHGYQGIELAPYSLAAIPGRRPADGTEPYLRPEVGFNPNWFHIRCGIDFSTRWHEEPTYRLETLRIMAADVRRRFPGHPIGGLGADGEPRDLLTGMQGAAVMGGIFGLPIRYFPNAWPANRGTPLADDGVARLEPPDLGRNAFFQDLLRQVDGAAALTGSAEGYLNWQGVLNTAYRLRGETIFSDLIEEPAQAHHVFEVVATTMIDAVRAFYARQKRHGFEARFLSIANCMLNMISPAHFSRLLPAQPEGLPGPRGYRPRRSRASTTRAGRRSSDRPAALRHLPEREPRGRPDGHPRSLDAGVGGGPDRLGDDLGSGPGAGGGADLADPVFGGPVPDLPPGLIPVFWACGATPQEAARAARIPLMVTHAPGHAFVSDLEADRL